MQKCTMFRVLKLKIIERKLLKRTNFFTTILKKNPEKEEKWDILQF